MLQKTLRVGWVGFFIALVWVGPWRSRLAQPALPLADYWQLVEQTQSQIAGLESQPQPAVKSQLQAIAGRWEAFQAVLLPDGATITVDTHFLVNQLLADPPDLASLSALFTTLHNQRSAWPQGKFGMPETLALKEILSRPEFQWQPQQLSPLEQWWADFKQRLRAFLAQLLQNARINLGIPYLSYLLIGLGVLAIAITLGLAFLGIRRSLLVEADISADLPPGDENLTADSAHKKGQELSQGGDYRLAVRYLYLSSLLHLEERGVLRYDRSKTNREYLRSVTRQPEVAAILGPVIEVFDRVWYGFQPLDEAAYARYAAQVSELRQYK